MHHRGVATLLLEHLVSLARARGVQVFTATTLPDNTAMLRVFADAGLNATRRLEDGVVELVMPIPRSAGLGETSHYLDAVAGREQQADVASLEPLLAPRSVAVIGVSHQPGSIGRSILLNIRDAGFTGALYAVNPHGGDVDGIRCVASATALPEAPDLAVVTVPAGVVLEVAQECGDRGARSLVVITSGLTRAQSASLLATCRRTGMRLVGPNCFGVAVPGIGLDATFAAHHPLPGRAGLVVQSGGVGVALLEHLSRLGIGISSFASVGDKLDVSGNDMLQWWAEDGHTRLAVLYLESFGNPRKFARTAARVSAHMPVLTVHAGRSAVGQRAAASHTAAAAAPMITRQALFEQAGVIATTNFGELLEAAVLLAEQPVPAGRRVCVISNAGGAGVLAADACVEAGLSVATPSHLAQAQLTAALPAVRGGGRPDRHHRRGQRGRVRRRAGHRGRRHRGGRGPRADRADRRVRPRSRRWPRPSCRCRWPRSCSTRPIRCGCCPAPTARPECPRTRTRRARPGRSAGPPGTARGGPGPPTPCRTSRACRWPRPRR